jgi:hypothetical protein
MLLQQFYQIVVTIAVDLLQECFYLVTFDGFLLGQTFVQELLDVVELGVGALIMEYGGQQVPNFKLWPQNVGEVDDC